MIFDERFLILDRAAEAIYQLAKNRHAVQVHIR